MSWWTVFHDLFGSANPLKWTENLVNDNNPEDNSENFKIKTHID